jgi:2-enoate reductase
LKKDAKIQELLDFYGEWFLDGSTIENGKMTSNLYRTIRFFTDSNQLSDSQEPLVMAPMGNISMCDETGRPNEKMIAYFTERAKAA